MYVTLQREPLHLLPNVSASKDGKVIVVFLPFIPDLQVCINITVSTF